MALSEKLLNERGFPNVGVCIWRKDMSQDHVVQCSVGEFLARPENQSGTWLIDGGWGGPPGPIYVRWTGAEWESGGFGGRLFPPQKDDLG